jgi:hypothetical protein
MREHIAHRTWRNGVVAKKKKPGTAGLSDEFHF